MANVKAKRHTHKYYKAREYRGKDSPFLWACALPDCSHHMPKHMEAMLEGKYTVCWSCGETTVLDSRTLKTDKPICEDCDPDTNVLATVEALKDAGIINKLD